MTSARGPVQSAGEHADGEHARDGSPPTSAEAGAPAPAGALDGPAAAAARAMTAMTGHPRLARLAGPATGRVREAHLLRLQRAYGNAAVGRHLQRMPATALADADLDPAARTTAAGAGHASEATRSEPGGRAAVAIDRRAAPSPAGGPAAVASGRGTATGSGTVHVQRWKDDGHKATTREAAGFVFGDPYSEFFAQIKMQPEKFIEKLADASVRMDAIVPHLADRFMPGSGAEGQTTFYGFVGTLAKSLVGDKTGLTPRQGQTRRGIKGEGPDHGEAGYYQKPKEDAKGWNTNHAEGYVDEAVDALKQGDVSTMILKLGDACHVAADRGSHDEGGIGEGHDTRMPDESQGESGTDLSLGPGKNYMENWADNDIVALNPKGYKYGVNCTELALRQFKIKAWRHFGWRLF